MAGRILQRLRERSGLVILALVALAGVGIVLSALLLDGPAPKEDAAVQRKPTPTPTLAPPQGIGQPTIEDLGVRLAYARVDSTGIGTLVIHQPFVDPVDVREARGVFSGISWSSDGQQVAFSMGPSREVQDIYVVGIDGSRVRRLTNDGHSKRPTWSPDGEKIAFVRTDSEATRPGAIYSLPADGGVAAQKLSADADLDYPAWSPDGASLAAVRQAGTVSLISAKDGAETQRVDLLRDADPTASSFAWSPDGESLAGVVRRKTGLAIVALGDSLTSQRQVGGPFLGNLADPGWANPSWVAGSEAIIAAAESGRIMIVLATATSKDMPTGRATSNVAILLNPPTGQRFGYPAVFQMAGGGGASQVRLITDEAAPGS